MADVAAHAAAIANAIGASGVLVRVDPSEFLRVLHHSEEPLIVVARGGFIRPAWRYLTSYKGLAVHTKSREQLPLPGRAQIVTAESIWIPG